MKIVKLITGAARRIAHDVADAPRVRREIRRHRAAQAPARRVPAPLAADDITGEVPAVADIEEAARLYEQARQATNAAARTKRLAEKVLKRTPDGRHGVVVVERFESSRQVADLDAIREVFEANGLGPVPMKRCAPSLTITWAEESAAPEAVPVLAAA